MNRKKTKQHTGGTKPKIGGRRNTFWKFLGIYSGVWVVLIAIIIFWVYNLLEDYEESMPDSYMNKVLAQFEYDYIPELVNANAEQISAYEKQENIVAYLQGKIAETKPDFVRKSGEFTSEKPVYMVKAGDTGLAKVTLAQNGTNRHRFTVWKTEKVEIGQFLGAENAFTITAPSKAEVLINGKKADDSILSEKNVPVDILKNIADFTELPANNVYQCTGLMAEPDIQVMLDGAALTVTKDQKTGNYTAAYPGDDILQEAVSEHITNINTEYGKYIINRGSLSRLKQYMIGNARQYVSDIPAIWAFLWGKEYTYEFKNNEIKNFVKYSEDCFTCDVHFDLYVDWGTGNKTYDTNLAYVFVKQDDAWYLADFSIN